MAFDSVPRSLALIPDGNRRWAKAHALSVLDGYNLGVEKFIDFSEWCRDYGINNLTVWALSSENIRRSTNEVKALFNIYRRVAKDRNIVDRLHRNEVRLNIISNDSLIPPDLSRSLKELEDETADNKNGVINMLIGYGGQDDIVFAVRKAAKLASCNRTINAETFRELLLSSRVPEIDFTIRTSGEQRLSGFIPWQIGYSELYFSGKLWPDFTRRDLYNALADYNRRDRRFGR
ncbi:MAG: polyprenyl diphosphate synthase [Candidatus Marsarchaeota archaeon]|nr:polyprenyl diphosphate synthase [Candidatus Marsarchaeota archaeon]MCL5412872.1 polyprenyl diphosphate synthase [Candidatus Marsarchaeota archaeon]